MNVIVNLEMSEIAIICHEVNKAYCEAFGDFSQKHWKDAELWQKQSALTQVEAHLDGKFNPEDSHNSWCKEKFAAGWVYGPVKDGEKKTHPDLVEYSKLSPVARGKDYIFNALVTQLSNIR